MNQHTISWDFPSTCTTAAFCTTEPANLPTCPVLIRRLRKQCSSVGCWQELTPLNNALTQERKLSRTLDSFGTSPTSVASQFIPLHSRQSSGAYLDACCAIRPAKEADSEPCWPFCASFNSCAYAVVLDVHGSRSQHGFQRPREHS